MDKQLRERIVGATILVGLGVVFIPLVLDEPVAPSTAVPLEEPRSPEYDPSFPIPPPRPQAKERPRIDPDSAPARLAAAAPENAETDLLRPGAGQSRDAAPKRVPGIAEASPASPSGPRLESAPDGARPPPAPPALTGEMPAPALSELSPLRRAAAEKSNAAPAGGWIVQLASFRQEDNARKLNAQLHEAEFHSFVREVRSGEQIYYSVQVGPELSREEAEKQRARLQERFSLEGLVRRYP